MVQLMVRIDLESGAGLEAAVPVVNAVIAVRREPGCLEYRAFIKKDSLFIVESWESDEALAAHARGSAYTTLIDALGPLMSEKPSIMVVEELGLDDARR